MTEPVLTRGRLEALYVADAALRLQGPGPSGGWLATAYDRLAGLTAASGENWQARPAKAWLREVGLVSLPDVKTFLDAVSAEARSFALRALLDDWDHLAGDV